jgi:hypothetical protein
MILPSKHLPQDRALLTVGSHILTFLGHPKTVSALWEQLSKQTEGTATPPPRLVTYDWFLLTLDLLYALGTIELEGGLVARRTA